MPADAKPRVRLRFRRALGLACLAPLVAETIASSNTPAILFPILLPLLVLIYGIPALLIRELWMRRWIGWPGFCVLGIAYTALNEGVVAATWFKLDPDTAKVLAFTAEEAGRAAGLNWAVAMNLTVYHTFWSMLVPIVLMEAWTRSERGRPWLPGWAIALATAVVAFVVVGSLSQEATDRVCEAPTRQVFDECASGRRGAALFILAATIAALLLPRWHPRRSDTGWRPSNTALVWCGGCYSVAFLACYFVLPLSGNPAAAEVGAVVLYVAAIVAILRWSRAPTWTLYAATLLATGALVPGMLTTLRAVLVLQPIAAGLFAWFFLRPALQRAQEPELA